MKVGYNKETGKITIVIDPTIQNIDDPKLWFRMYGMVRDAVRDSRKFES